MKSLKIAVCGAATASEEVLRLAFQVGAELARRKAILLTGAGRGVMAAANRGAKSNDGTTLGIYPTAQPNPGDTDESIDLAIHTGFGQGRNLVLVLSAQAVIAVGGEWGTLSEIALASKHGRPVIGLATWQLNPPQGTSLEPIIEASTAKEAVSLAIDRANGTKQ